MNTIRSINKDSDVIQILSRKQLENVIRICSNSYYNTDTPLVSDSVYDSLIERLTILCPSSPILSVTGSPISFAKVELPYYMGSMNKIKTSKHIDKWIDNHSGPYILSDKLDGISCIAVISKCGSMLYTRGDGTYGRNITHLAELVNMGNPVCMSDKLVVRGELVMSKKSFSKYDGANARNLVSGITNSKPMNLSKDTARDVDFVAYEILCPSMKYEKHMSILREYGFNVVYNIIEGAIDANMLDGMFVSRKRESEYEIDGIIVTASGYHDLNTSGNPEYSFAYKGDTQSANVTVTDVVWKVSKDSILVPKIKFEPVTLSGAELKCTSGFNARYIVDNKIGKGAVIKMVRSGDVIPYILEVVNGCAEPALPDCEYSWDKNSVNIISDDVDDATVSKIVKFMSDIGVEYVSEGIVSRIVGAGYTDIFSILSMDENDLMGVPGIKDVMAAKIVSSIDKGIMNAELVDIMCASNCFGRGLGKKKLDCVLDIYPDIVVSYTEQDRGIWENKISSIKGFSEATTEKFLCGMAPFLEFHDGLSRIYSDIPSERVTNKINDGRLTGKTIVFSGFRDATLEKRISDSGGKCGSSVSKKTFMLVYFGDTNTSKYKKAAELGVRIMSRSEFIKYIQ